MQPRLFRASILHFLHSPLRVDRAGQCYEYIEDGVLIVQRGRVIGLREYSPSDEGENLVDYSGKLILPGFIDAHLHYPQTEMIASYGEQLLQWLETYTFPTEGKFGDKAYAEGVAKVFLNELLRNGTTSAMVFATIHPESVDALFEQAERRGMRIIAGKVMMDQNAPAYLLDTAVGSYEESRALIEKWHGRGRLSYAITPRFAPTSSPEQLRLAARLHSEYPDTYLQTHLSESRAEIAWVGEIYPEREGYLDVYHHYGLTGPNSVFSHCIHLSEQEWRRLAETDSVCVFCPTSNLFLGSGLFDMGRAKEQQIRVGLGSDVGAGTSFSLLHTLNEAYKVSQLRGYKLSAFKSFYLATLGSARALGLDGYIGNFAEDKEADFVVWDYCATPLQKFRMAHARTLEEKLFGLIMLGDDRNVHATYIAGNKISLDNK